MAATGYTGWGNNYTTGTTRYTSADTSATTGGYINIRQDSSINSGYMSDEDHKIAQLKDEVRNLEYQLSNSNAEKSALMEKILKLNNENMQVSAKSQHLMTTLEIALKTISLIADPNEFFEMFKKVRFGDQNAEMWSAFLEGEIDKKNKIAIDFIKKIKSSK
jgi:hypothetical protein